MPARGGRAFTLVELVLVLAVVALLAGLILPRLLSTPRPAYRIRCLVNLKQVALSFRVYATDNADRFPRATTNDLQVGRNWETELIGVIQMLSNELVTPYILECPGDTRKAAMSFSALATTNLSYFVSADGSEFNPVWVIAGDSNLTTNGTPVAPGLLTLRTNLSAGWTTNRHPDGGNVALCDGSVQQVANGPRAVTTFRPSILATNRLLVP